jgi:hypothetical protein
LTLVINPLNPKLMKVPVKTRVLLSIFSVLQLTTFAQLKLPVANPIANDIKKVVEDYPNQFRNLMGDLIIRSYDHEV